MGKVIAEITMSLDGFIAGPGISSKEPMGTNGQRLHEWIFGKATDTDKALLAEVMNSYGAVITGNHTYSTAIDNAWEGVSPFTVHAFVLCQNVPPKKVRGFSYVTNGIDEALNLSRKTAGEKDVWVMGGAGVIQQYINAGLIDELRLHIAPLLLMKGTRLFENGSVGPIELIREPVIETPGALHTVFLVKK